MNEKFALFMHSQNEPNGGAHDFVAFGALDELKAAAEREMLLPGRDHQEAHVAEVETMKVVAEASVRYDQHPLTGYPPTKRVEWS